MTNVRAGGRAPRVRASARTPPMAVDIRGTWEKATMGRGSATAADCGAASIGTPKPLAMAATAVVATAAAAPARAPVTRIEVVRLRVAGVAGVDAAAVIAGLLRWVLALLARQTGA